MLDGKILAAVFATLTAIGTAMNGGAIDAGDLRPDSSSSGGSGINLDDFLPKSFEILSELREKPEPTNRIEAVLDVEELENQKIYVRSSSLRPKNITSANIGNRKVKSDETITLYGFTGDVMPGKPSNIEGRAQGVLTSGVNVSGRFPAKQEFETGLIVANDIERTKIDIREVNGTIDSDSTSAQVSDVDLKINSFSGNMTIHPRNGTVGLSGKIDKLSAGDVSFGG
jgi:hypothetical protein